MEKYIFVCIAVALGIFLSVCSFAIPFTTVNFNGFANSIPLGLDVAGGYSAVYDIVLEDDSKSLDEEIDSSVQFISDVLARQGYTDAIVTKQGQISVSAIIIFSGLYVLKKDKTLKKKS